MKIRLFSFDLELKHPFQTSHGVRTVQPTLIVELSHGEYTGIGEATATSYYGYTIQEMKQSILEKKNQIEKLQNIISPTEFHQLLCQLFPKESFLRCAIDIAYHDLFAKINQKPLYKQLGLSLENIPITNFTIGLDSSKKMLQKLKDQPWPIYKIKLGVKNDIDIIKALRKESDSIFRVDANCGWTAKETIEKSKQLKTLGIEFIEQPIHPNKTSKMAELYKKSYLPLIADESCQTESDIERCKGLFHGVNIKLTKCGGITPALRMLKKAKQLGLKTMIGCMTESTVGISAIAHLTPLLDFVDMDGAMLLKKDIATGVSILPDGNLDFPNSNGTGARLSH